MSARGNDTGAVRRRQAAAFVLALLAGAHAVGQGRSEGGMPAQEDAADALQGSDRVEAYERLRTGLIAAIHSGNGKRGADHAAQLGRIDAKLALAIRLRATPSPNGWERRAMAREASRIGTMHVRRGDPERAVRYEAFVESIEHSSPATNLLRNATRRWFRDVLQGALDRRDWDAARAHVKRWGKVLGDDPSVDEGRRAFADARRAEIVRDLHGRDARKAIAAIKSEEKALPGQPAWRQARDAVRQALVKDVEAAHAQLEDEEMRESIDRLRAFFPREERIAALEEDLAELERIRQPLPITRRFGMVRNPFIRITGEIYFGSSSFEAANSESELDFKLGFMLNAEARLRAIHPRTREVRPVYLGAAASGIFLDAITDNVTARGTLSHAEVLLGVRRGRAAAHIGFGPVFHTYAFEDDVALIDFDGLETNFVAGSLAAEVALSKRVTLYGRGSFSFGEPVEHIWGRAGVRFYPTPNISLSVGLNTFSSTITPDAPDPEVEVTVNAFTVGAVVQF